MSEAGNNLQGQTPKTCELAKWCFGLAILSVSIVIYLFVADRISYLSDSPEWFFIPFPYCLIVLAISCPTSGLIGIAAIFKVSRRRGQLKGMRLAIGGTVISGTVAAIIISVLILIVRPGIHQVVCGTNLSGLGKALEIYASDCDGRYPTADKWCDLLVQGNYASEKQFVCPGGVKGRSHYAINPNAERNSPADMVLLFETKGGWNQCGGQEILSVRNHWPRGCNILFMDTFVEFIKPERLEELKWKVGESKK